MMQEPERQPCIRHHDRKVNSELKQYIVVVVVVVVVVIVVVVVG